MIRGFFFVGISIVSNRLKYIGTFFTQYLVYFEEVVILRGVDKDLWLPQKQTGRMESHASDMGISSFGRRLYAIERAGISDTDVCVRG